MLVLLIEIKFVLQNAKTSDLFSDNSPVKNALNIEPKAKETVKKEFKATSTFGRKLPTEWSHFPVKNTRQSMNITDRFLYFSIVLGNN